MSKEGLGLLVSDLKSDLSFFTKTEGFSLRDCFFNLAWRDEIPPFLMNRALYGSEGKPFDPPQRLFTPSPVCARLHHQVSLLRRVYSSPEREEGKKKLKTAGV